MIRKILLIFMMMVVFSGGDMAMASEVQPPYLSVIDELSNSGNVLHTVYPGMSLEDIMANFKGATQWTLEDDGELGNLDPNVHSHFYYWYRNIGDIEPVYEVLRIYTDSNNEYIEDCSISFYTNSEKIAKEMFDKITNEMKMKYGIPYESKGKHRSGFGYKEDGKFEILKFDYMATNSWTNPIISTSWSYMKDRTAEVMAKTSHLPEVMNYSVRGFSFVRTLEDLKNHQ